MQNNGVFGNAIASQANYSKRCITVDLHINMLKHVSNELKIQNWYVTQCIKSVFSKLALLLRVWQRISFTKSERIVKQRNLPFRKKKSPFITEVILFLNLKHIIESGGGVLVTLNMFSYVFKGKQLN